MNVTEFCCHLYVYSSDGHDDASGIHDDDDDDDDDDNDDNGDGADDGDGGDR